MKSDKQLLNFCADVIEAAIRVLFNSSREDFNQIFGDIKAPYLWNKFVNEKNAVEGDFICCLDAENRLLLAQAALDYLNNGGGYP